MTKSGKIVTVLLAALILLSLSSTAVIYYYFYNERTSRINLEKQLQETKRQLEWQTKISKNKIDKINDQLAESRVKIDGLTTQLDTEKIAKGQIILERDNLITELNKKSVSLQESTDRLSKTQERVTTLKEQIAQLRLQEKTEDETREVRQGAGQLEEIELGKIVVASEEIPKGEILSVNKKYNFVVINLGEKDAIKLGQIFSIYRKKRFIGNIKIVKLQDELSVADLSADTKINSICKGDKVIVEE